MPLDPSVPLVPEEPSVPLVPLVPLVPELPPTATPTCLNTTINDGADGLVGVV